MAQCNIEIVPTKVNFPTILVEHEGRMLPIHSKYNPIVEAERFIDSLKEEIEKSDHLLFYGVGLGYHIKIAQERYPEKVFSVYEPLEQVSGQFNNFARKIGVNLKDLAKNYVELSSDNIIPNIIDFSIYFAQRVLLITLPIYGKLVPTEMKLFNDNYKKLLKEKVGSKQVEKRFSERWAINMLMNVKHTFTTPNILMQEANFFEGKPIILAAAGPSLSDEIDNLKYIKEKGLAYIFAVGSANRALINYGVLPDAVLSYDPQGTNWRVFEEIMEKNIDTIPLIFGTTIGHETVDYYPGPKAHVVMSKDTLTPYLHDAEIITVDDSSTISNVTFQILQKLKVGKIILVGQNFAYRDEQYYANGIKRYDVLLNQHTDGKLKEVEIEKSFYVEDVYGNEVRTNVTLDTMRKEMEYYLSINENLAVVNTTKGGAKITGAPFASLDELLEKELVVPLVQRNWYELLRLPKMVMQQKRLTILENENNKFIELLEEAKSDFVYLIEQSNSKNIQKLDRILSNNMREIDKLHKNLIYKLLIKSISDIYTEQIFAEVSLCNKITDPIQKAKSIANIYIEYLSSISNIYKVLVPIFYIKLQADLKQHKGYKFYNFSAGFANFQGNWHKAWITAEKEYTSKNMCNYGTWMISTEVNSTCEFKFKGTKLQILGLNNGSTPLRIKIEVDNNAKIITIPANIKTRNYDFTQTLKIYDVTSLASAMHTVKLEIISDQVDFKLLGVLVDNSGRLYHEDEVIDIKELSVGKRIRSKYCAKTAKVGKFSDLGSTNGDFIDFNLVQPNGDFYFIAVEENQDNIILIADRVIQSWISWETIEQSLKNYNITEIGKIDFITGGYYNYKNDNEWDKYIASSTSEWNIENAPLSWAKEINSSQLDKKGLNVTLRGSWKDKEVIINYSTYGTHYGKLLYAGFRPKLILSKVDTFLD